MKTLSRLPTYSYSTPVVLLFFAVFFSVAITVFAITAKTTILFYSSETTINNYKSLKIEFDRYLGKFGPYAIQPFSDRETFEKYIKDKKECLLLMSSWHYRKIYKDFSLKAALTGTRNGEKYQKRILIAKDTSVKSGLIASASSIQHTRNYLNSMLQGKVKIDTTKILTVPKDIDALMSVGFGMADLALTTRRAFEELKAVNPNLHQRMKIIVEGERTLSLILAVHENLSEDADKMLSVIQNMSTDPAGKEKIRMLGLDDWQVLDPSDRLRLEAK
jgi:hypothetical protein